MFKRIATTALPRMSAGTQCRALNIHEYASKELLRDYGCKVEQGIMCQTLEEVKAALGKIKSEKKVVKSQILAGGRGKGTFVDGFKGGVHVCENTDKAMEVAKKMLHNKLVTKQTNGKGVEVRRLYVTEAINNIKKELYVALILDRKHCCPTFIGSAEGGMGIEELAKNHPDKIKYCHVNIHNGIDESEAEEFAASLGLDEVAAAAMAKQMASLYWLAKAKDCTMVEINPMVQLDDSSMMCIDAKLSFDDNARFRHPEIWELEDRSEKDPKEIIADEADLNYIALNGNVGCMVNGAGLAMATMDLISLYGQAPANFLDVGGSAEVDQIIKAFDIITRDENVKVILVNIFGGIMKCDVIADGIVAAVKNLGSKLSVPIVVRLEGTNDSKGREILKQSGLPIHPVLHLDEAGRTACDLIKNSGKAAENKA